jgi:hypothetical protein
MPNNGLCPFFIAINKRIGNKPINGYRIMDNKNQETSNNKRFANLGISIVSNWQMYIGIICQMIGIIGLALVTVCI